VLQSWPTVAERDFVVEEAFEVAPADGVCVAGADLGAAADAVFGRGSLSNWLSRYVDGTSRRQ
jgi:hypothetical protein